MQIQEKRVVVTGGAGFIGSHLVELLLSRGNDVVVVDNFYSGKRENLNGFGDRLKIVEADVRDLKAMEHCLDESDVVFHLATHCVRLSLEDPRINHDVNATGTLNVLLAARKAKVERFVYCSSSEVYGDIAAKVGGTSFDVILDEGFPKSPTTVYGASKLVGEHYTQSFFELYGLPATIVRPFNAYGPRSNILGAYGEVIPRFAIWMKTGQQPVIFGDGTQTRDFTYVTDTAEGILRCAESESLLGNNINIAFGAQVEIGSLVDIINKKIGTQILPKFEDERPGDIYRLGADTTKSEMILGWSPRVTIEEGVGRYLRWLEEQGTDWEGLSNQLEGCNYQLLAQDAPL